MKIITVIFMCLSLFMAASPALSQAEDAAMVVDMGGSINYENGPNKGNQVALMDFLALGDVIHLKKGATLILNYFASGQREEINGPGQITVGLNRSKRKEDVTVKSEKVEFVPPKALVQSADSQHMGVIALRSPSPMGRSLTASLSPNQTALRGLPLALSWDPQPGVSRYEVVVADILEDVVYKTETDGTQCLVEKTELKPGEEYIWKAQDADAPDLGLAGQARFYLLNPEQLAELSHTENYIKKTYKEGTAEYLIALAMLYKKYELNSEARTVLEALLRGNPGNRNIRQQVQSLAGNYHP